MANRSTFFLGLALIALCMVLASASPSKDGFQLRTAMTSSNAPPDTYVHFLTNDNRYDSIEFMRFELLNHF